MSDKTREALRAFEAWWRLPDNDRTTKAIEPAMRLCIEALVAPPAADARELARKVREHTFRATPDGSEIVGHVIALDEAAALIDRYVAVRVEAALSEAADRAVKYAGSVYWYQSEYSRDCWDIDYEDLHTAIMGGEK